MRIVLLQRRVSTCGRPQHLVLRVWIPRQARLLVHKSVQDVPGKDVEEYNPHVADNDRRVQRGAQADLFQWLVEQALHRELAARTVSSPLPRTLLARRPRRLADGLAAKLLDGQDRGQNLLAGHGGALQRGHRPRCKAPRWPG